MIERPVRLTPGSRLGQYEIVGSLGAGGMGEVYRARDPRLRRDVAIKVLPAVLADNPRRLLRFEREARALAALNHPNIAGMYGIEEAAPGDAHSRAIVMELVEGDDLAVILRRGAMPLGDVLPIARQVAEALAAAHDAGIVHRDLKPANIKVKGDGVVKVLDFGLAKGAVSDTTTDIENGSNSGSGSGDLPPTITLTGEVTEDGAVIGTAAYMAPEQARGKLVDKRADIWAFGVVLYEMLAGVRPFAGADPADTIARVVATDPDWSRLPADTPASVRRLLFRCLTKERKQRLHDITDARLEIEEALAPAESADFGAVRPRRSWLPWATALICAFAGVVIGGIVWKRPLATQSPAHARIDVAPATELNSGGKNPWVVLPPGGARVALAWSPDGRTLAFIGVRNGIRQIYLRPLSSAEGRPLAGTEGAMALGFSPDGSEIVYGTQEGVLSMNVAGGPAAQRCGPPCDVSATSGLNWTGNLIALGQGSLGVLELSASGNSLKVITQPQQLVRHVNPHLLPGGKTLLYTELRRQWTSGDEQIMAIDLTPGAQPRLLLRNAADARYLPTGHLAFLRQGTLLIVPFDAATATLTGEPVAVIKDVAQAVVAWDSADLTMSGQYAISPTGSLAYVSAPPLAFPDRELVSVSRSGAITAMSAPAAGYRSHIDLSPDGRRLGVTIQNASRVQPFVYDIDRRTLFRVGEAQSGEVALAGWSGNRMAIEVVEGGQITASLIEPVMASAVTPVPESVGFWASSLSSRGVVAGMRAGDIWCFPTDSRSAKPIVFTSAGSVETQPMWSPDGQWLAFTSDSTGRPEVYVRPYPGPGTAVVVSTNGGRSPAWNRNGRELFYVEQGQEQNRMMSVTLSSPGKPGDPRALFTFPRTDMFEGTTILTPYAVAADGQSFFTTRSLRRPQPVTQINVILNWFEELKARGLIR